jgi:mevalonate kinase
MQKAAASACGKAILLGEHFVVHGSRALAIPLGDLRTEVTVELGPGGPAVRCDFPDPSGAIRALARAAELAGISPETAHARIRSRIPTGCGLGSSAALAVALTRAVASLAGAALDDGEVSARAFELERLAHGTPSGVDNAVVAFERPLCFRRGVPPEVIEPGGVIPIVVADTGERFSTAVAVSGVAAVRARDERAFAGHLEAVDAAVGVGLGAIERGDAAALGPVLDAVQERLAAVGVSSPALERLIAAARTAGALGAKLTGAGRGGSILAVVRPGEELAVAAALTGAGAKLVQITRLEAQALDA